MKYVYLIIFVSLICLFIALFISLYFIINKEKFLKNGQVETIKYLKKNMINSKEKSGMISLLKSVSQFLDSHLIDYFCVDGTALGMYRDSDIIPWDDDIDISITKENLDKLINTLKNSNTNLVLIKFSNYYKIYDKTISLVKNNREYNWPFIDIFLNWKYNNKINIGRSFRDLTDKDRYNYNIIYPTRYYNLNKLKLKGPNNLKKYCEQNFGKKCKKLCYPSEWDHRKEQKIPYDKKPKHISCNLLKKFL